MLEDYQEDQGGPASRARPDYAEDQQDDARRQHDRRREDKERTESVEGHGQPQLTEDVAEGNELAKQPDEKQHPTAYRHVGPRCHRAGVPLVQFDHSARTLHRPYGDELLALVALARHRHGLDLHVQHREKAEPPKHQPYDPPYQHRLQVVLRVVLGQVVRERSELVRISQQQEPALRVLIAVLALARAAAAVALAVTLQVRGVIAQWTDPLVHVEVHGVLERERELTRHAELVPPSLALRLLVLQQPPRRRAARHCRHEQQQHRGRQR